MPDQVLTEENLALHTEHHKKLVQKRDFVAEFIEQLVPTSLPRVNPIREARLSDEGVAILRNIQPKSKKDSDVKAPKPAVSPPKEQSAITITSAKLVVKKKRARKESAATATPAMEELQRLSAPALVLNKSHPSIVYKGKGKRRPPSDAIDLDVENLALDDVADAKVYSTQAKPSPSAMTWPGHGDQGDCFSQQAVEERHDGHGRRREPLRERVNEKYSSSHPHRRHHQPRHQHRRHIQRSLYHHEPPKARALQEARIAKPNRNKPRKILTQGSLVMNQFESSKIAKERITIPGNSGRLGIFKKGKASTRVVVNKDRGFSENSFLNRGDDLRQDDCSEPLKAITSDYFTPKESYLEVAMASNCNSSKDSANFVGISSRHSKHSRGKRKKRQSSNNSTLDSPITRKRARHQRIGLSLFRSSQEEQVSQLADTEATSIVRELKESVYEDLVDGDLDRESLEEAHIPGSFGGSTLPSPFESTEPLLYYETLQAHPGCGHANIPYPTPADYPFHSILMPSNGTVGWPAQVIEPQSSSLSGKDRLQPAEMLEGGHYFQEDGDYSSEYMVEDRAHTQPPRAQFHWRPRRLY